MFTSAVCWGLRKSRNSLCFQGVAWISLRVLWQRVLSMIRSWRMLVPLKEMAGFHNALVALEKLVYAPERLPWRSVLSDGSSDRGSKATGVG
jgi:hypothetical protein